MRGGSESFLIKDSAFYQSKMTAALGVDTIAVYEELRSHVWRSRTKGSARKTEEFKNGRLSACIRRQDIADSTGLSVKTVQRRINTLRDVGWIRAENGQLLGDALIYELGYLVPGGAEVFYADVDCREFCNHLADIADKDDKPVYKIPIPARVDMASRWFTNKNRAVYSSYGGGSHSPTPWVTQSHPGGVGHTVPGGGSHSPTPGEGGGSHSPTTLIENPPGLKIEKKIDHTQRFAPGSERENERDSAAAVEPSDRLRTAKIKTNLKEQEQEQKNQEEEQEQEEQKNQEEDKIKSRGFAIDSAIDTPEISGQDDVTRLVQAQAFVEKAKAKTDAQMEKDKQRAVDRCKSSSADQLTKERVREQRAANLKGGLKFPQQVYRSARNVWDAYVEFVQERDSLAPTVRWSATGNAKARGQLCGLVDMYGEETTILAVRYVVENWERIGERYFKDPGGVPSLGRLVSLHEPLVREAMLWGRHRAVMEEWNRWYQENPLKPAPDELEDRYEAARKDLEAIGFVS